MRKIVVRSLRRPESLIAIARGSGAVLFCHTAESWDRLIEIVNHLVPYLHCKRDGGIFYMASCQTQAHYCDVYANDFGEDKIPSHRQLVEEYYNFVGGA